jgi:hypothetical protein
MQDITLTINKSKVWHEVAKATSYTGAKMVTGDDPGAYDRIFTTDEDREMMERYWVEACSLATSQLREWVKVVERYELTVIKEIRPGVAMYSMVSMVNNTIL